VIVKLQKPLASSERDPPWLVYNQSRSFRLFVPGASLPAHVHKAMADRDRGFFEISIVNGTTKIGTWGRVLPDRTW
jgi:hypothetical protein